MYARTTVFIYNMVDVRVMLMTIYADIYALH